jgi:hypothetical protein
MTDQRELRGWLNTGFIAVMTMAWLGYAGWTMLESRRAKQAVERFKLELAARAAQQQPTWRLEVEDAPGTPSSYP